MSIIKDTLRLIMEGTILTEADMIDFTARHKAKEYEKQVREYTAQATKLTAEVHQHWTILDSKKRSGSLTDEQYIQEMMNLQPLTGKIRELEQYINDLHSKLDSLSTKSSP